MSKAPIEMMLDGVTWISAECSPGSDRPAHGNDGLPYATHSGIWDFMGQQIRVYRLSDGRAVIHADDILKVLGICDGDVEKR